jgi:hypothetical protein
MKQSGLSYAINSKQAFPALAGPVFSAQTKVIRQAPAHQAAAQTENHGRN